MNIRPDTPPASPAPAPEPPADCPLCPRLAAYRDANRRAEPRWHNAPVPSWGDRDAPILVVGMAPGVRGANRTGRPFTGDHAGILLYGTLIRFGLADGHYAADPADGLRLVSCRIANAVRCVPPKNLPTPAETRTCNPFLAAEIARMTALRVVVALGLLAHDAVLRARGVRLGSCRFGHGRIHALPDGLRLADSYHVSRYNTNTGRLTTPMFEAVIEAAIAAAREDPPPA